MVRGRGVWSEIESLITSVEEEKNVTIFVEIMALKVILNFNRVNETYPVHHCLGALLKDINIFLITGNNRYAMILFQK